MPEHTDADGRTTWTRLVYVIELDPAACEEKKSPCKGTKCGRTPVYVGQTALSREDRFAQHRSGVKASKWVTRYGLRLRADLVGEYGEMDSVATSEAAEADLAQALRDTEAFCVYGGH